jgi:SNF2 family DNA or RNA helicase
MHKAEEDAHKAQEAARLEAEALEKSGSIIKLVQAADLEAPLANGWHLRDYQKRGVEWLLARGKNGIYRGGILADHMGLGKTLTCLVAARAMQRSLDCAVFVIAPVSLLENWQREAERVQVAIEIFSWAKIPRPLGTRNYVLVADESHYAQNEKSQRTQKLLELANNENCLAAWLLTGTPIKNGKPINLYPLLLAIDHPLTQDRWSYHYRYCDAHKKSIGRRKTVWDVSGASHLDELAQKTDDAILRRTKQECLTELPAKTRLFKQAELAPSQAKEFEVQIGRLVKDYKERAQRGEVERDAEALVTLNILRKVGSRYKVDAAIALAEELLEQEQQVVLFTEFLESANAVYAALGGELLTGESQVKERQAMVDRFQSGQSKVFTGTIKAGGVGITLTAASHVILVDRPWTPGDCEQAEDRCHRLGQTNAVFSTWLQLGQIDRAIDELLESKQQRIELVLKGKRKTLRGLDSPKELAKQLLEML